MQRRWPHLLRGLLAATLLIVLTGGIPVLLVREVGWPLPTTMPAWDQIAQTITTGAIEDATIIKFLAVLVWLAWANFATGVVLEAVALARGRAALRVAGLRSAQHLAANLLATASIAIATLSRPTTPAAADPGQLRLAVAASLTEQPPRLIDLPVGGLSDVAPHGTPLRSVDGSPGTPSSARVAESDSTYEVQRGDTLWDLAERFLDDGLRWREIRDLNVGRDQSDGTRIGTDTEELRPGWSLLLPGRPHPPSSPAVDVSAVAHQGPVTVETGDTLWDLADEHLDDPYRWPEVYEDNRGVPQDDGGALVDPDLIQPGWILELPEAGSDPATTESPVDVEAQIDEPAPIAEAAQEGDASNAESDDRGSVVEDTDGAAETSVPMSPSGTLEQPTSGAGRPAGEEPATSSVHDQDGQVAVVPLVAAGSLVAGLVLTLDRIRRARRRRREPDRRIPLPTGDDRRAEQRLRTLADPDAAQFVDHALRDLAGHFVAHRPLPPIVLVSYSTDDVAVHLAEAAASAPDDWQSHDDLTWSRPRPAVLTERDEHAGTLARLPALVTLGTLAAGRVGLLNLGHAGCLHVAGDPDGARRLLGTWALELATTSRADALDVVVVGLDDLPSSLERLTVVDEPTELQAMLGRSHSNGHTNIPTTVVLAADLPADVAVLLRTTSELRPDVLAVTAGLLPRSGSSVLHLDDNGSAHLDPGDVTVDLLDLTDDAAPTTARLLDQALHDPDELVPIPDLPDDEDDPVVLDELDVADHDATPEPAVEVRVLGPVEIVGAAEPFRTNKTIELIVYLALHRSGAGADTLMEALWPEQEPRAARLYTEASRARKALGAADDGAPHLPDAELGRYCLAETVALDHERFASRVAAARHDRRGAVDHLRSALMLVRGVPLSSTATEYAWATNEFYRLAQEVVDAAHQLAQLCIEEERYDDAIWAAERGLTADPLAEILVRDLMEAAAATGNTARVHAAMTRLRRLVAEDGDTNDADDWLHPKTVELFERLSPRKAGGPAR